MRGFFWSAALHGSVFLLFLLAPRAPAFDWEHPDAIAVELISTPTPPPEEPPPEIPEPAPEPEPTVETPPPDVKPPEPEPVQPKPRKPPRTIRRFAAKRPPDEGPSLGERLREVMKPSEEPTENVEPSQPTPAPTASTAEVEAADFPYAWYLNVLRTKITDSWDPPGDRLIAGRAKQVLIRFRVHREGRVTDIRIETDSGTPGLDASARRAVDRARPFPPLPENYEGEVLDVAVRFTVAEGGS
jgi:TonB family protein